MLSRSLTVTSFKTNTLIDIWTVCLLSVQTTYLLFVHTIMGIFLNWTSCSEQMGRISAACAQDVASRFSCADPPDPADPPKVALGRLLVTPLQSHRGLG